MRHIRYVLATWYDIAASLAGYRLWPPRIYWHDPKTREEVGA